MPIKESVFEIEDDPFAFEGDPLPTRSDIIADAGISNEEFDVGALAHIDDLIDMATHRGRLTTDELNGLVGRVFYTTELLNRRCSNMNGLAYVLASLGFPSRKILAFIESQMSPAECGDCRHCQEIKKRIDDGNDGMVDNNIIVKSAGNNTIH